MATVVKTGNSYALRVPKRYVEDTNLELGQKVEIGHPIQRPKQDRERIQRTIKQLQEISALASIEDPVEWQREQRTDRSLPGR